VTLFEANSGNLVQALATGKSALNDVAFGYDAKLLAAASADGAAYVWRLSDGRQDKLEDAGKPLHAVAWSPNGERLAAGGESGALTIFTPFAEGEPKRYTLPDTILSLSWRGDGAMLAAGLKSGQILLIDPETGKILHDLIGHQGGVNALSFSKNGAMLASAGADGAAKLWRSRDAVQVAVIPSRPCAPEERTKEGGCPNLDVAFSPDNAVLAVAGQKGEVEAFNVTTGVRLFLLRGHQAPVTGVVWSASGARLATVDRKGGAVLWLSPKT
jgi:WD40 repeat protein